MCAAGVAAERKEEVIERSELLPEKEVKEGGGREVWWLFRWIEVSIYYISWYCFLCFLLAPNNN